MINNLELLKPLLNFEKEGDFYMLYIFKRKKDQTTDKANHQSVRTIKTYCIESVEHLEERLDEIIELAELFKARVYIHINKQNHKDVGLDMIIELANRIKQGNYNQKYLFDSVVGQVKTLEKRWIVDIDNTNDRYKTMVTNLINKCDPVGNKIIADIPTKNGSHLISLPFNVEQFKKRASFSELPDFQKKNPTLLYFPSSLEI